MNLFRLTRHYLFPWVASAMLGTATGTVGATWIAGNGSVSWAWMLLFWLIGGVFATVSFLLLGLLRRDESAARPVSHPLRPVPGSRTPPIALTHQRAA